MKTKEFIALFVVVLIAFVCGSLFVQRQLGEPTWGGKTVSTWVSYRVYDDGNTNYAAAQFALRQLDSNAVPTLLLMLNADESKWLNRGMILGRMRGLTEDQCHYSAAWACGVIGPGAHQALPALKQMFERRQCAEEPVIALMKLGPEGVQYLTNALPSCEEKMRLSILYYLKFARNDPSDAALAFYRAMEDPAPKVRAAAAWGTGVLKTDPPTSVPHLIQRLNDPDSSVRESAIQALGLFGKDAVEAVPYLLELTRTNSAFMASMARQALEKIDPAAADRDGR